tara:strand:- start:2569 stop:3243 length:675 start_codon:yes stop_codon:yes gene_type:complete
MSDYVVEAQGVGKSFLQGGTRINVLNGVNLSLNRGERVAILGRSGTGKSTLLHLLAGLDNAEIGDIKIGGVDITNESSSLRASIRNTQMGFVYQFHHLLAEFTALENVAMPLRLRGMSSASSNQLAFEMLKKVDLIGRSSHRPSELSGGERQRVAIARALIGDPLVVLADEPTGNLDGYNAEVVLELICELSEEKKIGFLVVTHDESIASRMHRTLVLANGILK